jgi:hypothetical protein
MTKTARRAGRQAEEIVKPGVSTIERAFQLARSASIRDIADIKRALDREGYYSRWIEGKAITRQLRELIKAAREFDQAGALIDLTPFTLVTGKQWPGRRLRGSV